jgi:hypothetical protein
MLYLWGRLNIVPYEILRIAASPGKRWMAGIIPVDKHETKEVPQGTANKILKQAGLK